MKYIRKSFTFDGKRYYVRGKTEREALKKLFEKQKALEEHRVYVTSSITVKDWAQKCIDTYKTNLKDVSLYNFKYRIDHYIVAYIGDIPLKRVRALDCQLCINHQTGKSKFLINQVYQQLNFLFEKAIENDLLIKNPARNITRPRGTKRSRRALTEYEESIFLKAIKNHHYGLYFAFQFGCGCRPSEAAGIEGRDLKRINDGLFLHIRGTKSAAADRTVPIPIWLENMLPVRIEPFQLLCTSQAGNRTNPRMTRRAWKSLEREMNILMGCRMYRNQLLPPYPLADDLEQYCLRHTYCTNLQKQGVDIRTAQYLMGHADIQMTANIYTHVGQSQIEDAYYKINSVTHSVPQLSQTVEK